MKNRREAIKLLLAVCAGAAALFGQLGSGLRFVYAGVKKLVLPKGTPMHTLTGKNPALLDNRELDITPVEAFQTMGLSNYSVAPKNWKLEVTGAVEHSKKFAYELLIERPAVERNVLLICPGFFAYNGRWKGISAAGLLAEAKLLPGVSQVAFSGPRGPRENSESFSLEDVQAGKVFLAYQVNGKPLPQKHGFPMRLVAEDHYGARWVKYVDKITAIAD